MAKLVNTANVSGEYLGANYTDTTQLIVELSALSVEKSADKMLWIDNNPLTYTILVKNTDPDPFGDMVTDVIFEDLIDPQIAALDTTSVTVDGVSKTIDVDFTYDPASGMFVFNPLGDIDAGDTVEIIFRVTKKQP